MNDIEDKVKGGEACFNITKSEYDHTLNRSEKLDNKVYISLTFYAFMFVFVIDLIDNILNFKVSSDIKQIVLIVLYILICFITISIFLYTLVKLVKLLKPMEIDHFNPKYLVQENMQEDFPNIIYTFALNKYADYIIDNNEKLEARFKDYNKCLDNITWIVILSFSLNILNMFINKVG